MILGMRYWDLSGGFAMRLVVQMEGTHVTGTVAQ